MGLLEDPATVALLRAVVRFGCVRYRKVFAAAGWESPGPGGTGAREEVLHEFLLFLARKGVDLEGVAAPRAYLAAAFRSFAEDARARTERGAHLYGELEGSPCEPEEGGGRGREPAGAARRRALELHHLLQADRDPGRDGALERLAAFPERHQLLGLLEHYPIVRESDRLAARLADLYRGAFGEAFPEEEAERLWSETREEETLRCRTRLEAAGALIERLGALLARPDRLAPGEEREARARLVTLRRQRDALSRRHAFLQRLKPSHVLQLLPVRSRPTLNALTVALHRTRARLGTCG